MLIKLPPIIGENDSGKTNLLTALAQLNPAQPEPKIDLLTDIPNFISKVDFDEDCPLISSIWEIEESDQNKLVDVRNVGKSIKEVRIEKKIKDVRPVVVFESPTDFELVYGGVLELLDKLETQIDPKFSVSGRRMRRRRGREGIIEHLHNFSTKFKTSKLFVDSIKKFIS